jgi:hypothetical protein
VVESDTFYIKNICGILEELIGDAPVLAAAFAESASNRK